MATPKKSNDFVIHSRLSLGKDLIVRDDIGSKVLLAENEGEKNVADTQVPILSQVLSSDSLN